MASPPEDDPIAGFLLSDEAPKRPTPPAPSPDLGGYDLAGDDPPIDDTPITPPVPPPIRAALATKAPKAEPETLEVSRGRVDQVWSRGAEWWPTLIAQAGVLLLTAYLAFATFAINDLATPMIVLVAGGIAFLAASYPIFITLERPVRMTPEQAAKDYYAALSHIRPHHRRMWLLLSNSGRQAREFSDFSGFRAYWKARIATLKGTTVGKFAPLHFRVADFQAEKSAGKTAIDGKYSVVVSAVDGDPDTRIATFHLASGFVKGPDSQWYLERGTLPDGEVT